MDAGVMFGFSSERLAIISAGGRTGLVAPVWSSSEPSRTTMENCAIPGLGRQSWADRIIGGGVVGVAIVVVEAVQDGDGERTEESVRLSCRKSRTGRVGASRGS